jgi:hypothetical protein
MENFGSASIINAARRGSRRIETREEQQAVVARFAKSLTTKDTKVHEGNRAAVVVEGFRGWIGKLDP